MTFIPSSTEKVFQTESCLQTEHNCSPLDIIHNTLNVILSKLEGKNLYIAGGSACTILDHLYRQKALHFRDIDLLIVMDRRTTNDEVQTLAEELKSKMPDAEKIDPLTDVPRTPKDVPLDWDSLFSAGKGFLLHTNFRPFCWNAV